MWELDAAPQHYAWGSPTALPEFLGREADGRPWAELWYGAHPGAPSRVVGGGALDSALAQAPERLLGENVARAFAGRLPYLLKVIAPDRPLSLQVHPDRAHAAESFAAENAAGLALDHPERNYRDGNHKPEMLLALSRFEAVCGFRTPHRALQVLHGLRTDLTGRLASLLTSSPTAQGMRAAFRTLLTPSLRPDPQQVADVAHACATRLEATSSPSPRVDRLVVRLQEEHPGDPGVVAALLLNPVTLHPGEAMYVPAGIIHSYISGLGVEIMASSDNVLRAGLTPKRVAIDEMLQCVRVQAAPPVRIAPEQLTAHTAAYYAPVDDFELTRTRFDDTDAGEDLRVIPGSGPRIVLSLEGEVLLRTRTGERRLTAGRSVFLPADSGPLYAGGRGDFVQASVP